MSYEIERKFLVVGDFHPFVRKSLSIKQGYLSSHPERSVRVRIQDKEAFLTIKGKGNDTGITRYEWEKKIDVTEADALLRLCEPGIIEKIRYIIPVGELAFEVDEFLGDNLGLLIAEIELPSEQTTFEHPEWLGAEVTGDVRFYNAYLATNPFCKWQ
ncbi:CYTH domain-containing protein [Microbacter margulisiae]|uniref:Adenylate cyclase n=1 Tax=Microbacter margulisiae TaxID=1350067 RepID=A0A7W5DNV6_9PORP|nr:CYTH domain-containing protein [Microbacter margulisiae]MBB3186370.1 adenylate cyclase [Microbacter margulisiae]